MVYSELYEADLWSDHRLQDLRSAAIELVSDSNIDEMAGYHLTLAVGRIGPNKTFSKMIFLTFFFFSNRLLLFIFPKENRDNVFSRL